MGAGESAGIRRIIESLDIDENDKNRLLELTPATYTGLANELVDLIAG